MTYNITVLYLVKVGKVMSNFKRANRELEAILGADLFNILIKNDVIKLAQLQAVISLLVKAGIDFDLIFTSGTRRTETSLELAVYLSPTTTLLFVIELDAGGNIFRGLPPI